MVSSVKSKNIFNLNSKNFKDSLQSFRPLTIDIIYKSFQVNSYFEDFKTIESEVLEDSHIISPLELMNLLFSRIQKNEKININSILENLISMIPSKSNSEEFNQKDQIIKEIIFKIKKFYEQNNKLIQSSQYNYFLFSQMLNQLKSIPFYPLIPRNSPPIEFHLPSDFVLTENVQIATNGIEIFMLIDHFVFIFKLLVGTELLTNSYKRVELDPHIKKYNQIVCYGQDVLVTSWNKSFLIKRKLNDEWELSEQFDMQQDSLVCSDGVVLIFLHRENEFIWKRLNVCIQIYSLNDGLLLHKKTIQIVNQRIQNIFLSPKFITTNGTSITITYESNGILNDFTISLINGQILSDNGGKEINQFLNKCHYLSILQDSVNNAFWFVDEKKIDELTKVYYLGRFPSFQPTDPFVINEIPQWINEKINLHYFGISEFKPFSTRKKYNNDILYGYDLDLFHQGKNRSNIFLFLFSSLFFNPFICCMDQTQVTHEEHQKFIEKYQIAAGKEESQEFILELFKFFIKNLFTNPIEDFQPIFSLWILRQYQFSWYSKAHSQSMADSYLSIFKFSNIQNIKIPSLFLNIFSINSIIDAMVDIDDINVIEKESALFIHFLQEIAYNSEVIKKNDKINLIVSNHLNVLFDLLPLISYRKRMVVTFFTFLDTYGSTSLRSFYDYSLFISMAISCLLVSKNDMKWSYNDKIDRSDVRTNIIKIDNLLPKMSTIYRHWKPLVNKNIKDNVKSFDAKSLFVFYKLIAGNSIDSILPDIENNIKTNKDLQLSLDLMYQYRNQYRKSMQDKNEKWIHQFTILIGIMNYLECKFDPNDDKKALISEFLQHDYHIAYNFVYSTSQKMELIKLGMKQLLIVINNLYQNHYEIFQPQELFATLFDSLTHFSKFNAIEIIDDDEIKTLDEIIQLFQQICEKILQINDFQCINKFSALYIIQFLGACKNKKVNEVILSDLLKNFDIENGCLYMEPVVDDYANFIYQALVIYLIPYIDCDKLEFLQNEVTAFNRYQWILLNYMIEFNSIKDHSILTHLIDSITNIDLFIQLGCYRSMALTILNKLNKIQKIHQIENFLENIIEKVGDEIESFYDDEILSLNTYFINEIKSNKENFVFKDQFIELINSSNEFTKEKRFCVSLKFISLIDEVCTNEKIMKKIKGYYSYAITHEHLSSSCFAMNAFNKCLSNQDFCDSFLKYSDLDPLFFKLKTNNDQLLIKKVIHKLNSLQKNSSLGEKSLFDIITTKDGFYFISPVIKKSSIGSLTISKKKESFVKIYLCEESSNNKLFNIVTHFDKNNFQDQTKIDLTINTFLKHIKITGNNMIIFNNASNSVRVVIFSNSNELDFITESENIFEFCPFVDRKSYGMFNIPKKKSFLNKQNIINIINNEEDFEFSKILKNNLNEKLCFQFLYGENKALFSINDIISISDNLKNNIIQSYKKHLTESTFFITAVKMISLHPEILNYNSSFMLKLFILIILNYDKFSIELLRNGEFPFPIENIIFKSNFQSNDAFEDLSRYTIQTVLNNIIKIPSFKSAFYYHIKNLYRETFSHFPRSSKIITPEKKYEKIGFIFISQFGENSKNQIDFLNNKNIFYKLPYLSTNTSFILNKTTKQLLFFSMNPNKRNWIFNSPFEFLILLKYFIYISSENRERELAKSCLFEAFFIESPIISYYSIEFLKHIFLKAPCESDLSNSVHLSYQRSLQFYQENLTSNDPFYNLFLNIEIMNKVDPSNAEFNRFFPELVHNSVQQNSKIDNDICLKDFSIYENNHKNAPLSNESQLFYTYQLYKLINIFSIKSNSGFPYFYFFKHWATIQQAACCNTHSGLQSSEIKKSFIVDCNDFLLMWTHEYTNEILESFIDVNFKCTMAPYSVISKTANKLTSLKSKFQYSLLLTIVLIIYQINHVFQFCDIPTAVQVVPDLIDYLTLSSSVQLIRNKIVVNSDSSTVPRIHIDRKSSYVNNERSESIIEQFSNEIKNLDMFTLQCQKVPWRVTFIGEEAIDASGPSRELMNEIATSIFRKDSNITIMTPSDLSLYIPYTNNFAKYKQVYYSIGVFIAIVIRTSIPQSIPFAPLVWNYIANETITERDIVSVDKKLNEIFTNLRNAVESKCEIHSPWQATNWLSKNYTIEGKVDKYINENEVEDYIKCVVNDRINSIVDPLNEIRNGFSDNLGFRPNMPFGNLFSKMAQSEATFSVEDLMAISRYRSCTFESQSVVNFWAAVKKLTMYQRSLLLKFITTQTRIPNDMNSNFTIDIVEKAPDSNVKSDDMLLGASTCFNRLYLPNYSNPDIAYQKIVTSIEFCQTMELT